MVSNERETSRAILKGKKVKASTLGKVEMGLGSQQ
jgi:hypothetical protein